MMKKLLFFPVFFSLVFLSTSSFAMSVTAFDSATNLANNLVGEGITISNPTYTGAEDASGYFSGGLAAGIGIDSGILLTSGFASNLDGNSNTSGSITGVNYMPGDTDLNNLVSPNSTNDAAILEFDFSLTTGNSAFFNYVFGSDEYNEYVNSSFNDVFGFFFEGENIALIPGTDTPVAINNVNNGLNSSYYNDNADTPYPYSFEYDGFTDVLTASISNLTPGDSYHLKLAIADTSDSILDSGVFLQGGSFGDTPPNQVPEPATAILLLTGLAGVAGFRKKFMS
ncbi:hypothetical protein HNR65_003247 [Desulfosalsimonas propionicica]|uniref:Ice-binding protein C-terminal domain-containing protein n=1 Tax=Desulfosalsimonas propionicica TaxID=332175 RepID=A0A7W0CBV0_9BACT|nr:choice-of-anchor L domain-containing protein [Desulfosalsimonas propionicica]MBA2882892.1 hypothetical protein [Desulfosalsimonas propionicica]